MDRKKNETLLELTAGIIVSGLVIQVVQLLVTVVYAQFRGSRVPFALGLWIGIATAVFLAGHMYRSIDRALDMAPSDAEGYMRKAYLFRTVIILAAAGVVTWLKLGYVMAAFLGMLCLKFGAFLQPLMHKVWKKFQK